MRRRDRLAFLFESLPGFYILFLVASEDFFNLGSAKVFKNTVTDAMRIKARQHLKAEVTGDCSVKPVVIRKMTVNLNDLVEGIKFRLRKPGNIKANLYNVLYDLGLQFNFVTSTNYLTG